MKRLVVVFLTVSILLLLGSLIGVQHMNETLGISQPEPLVIKQKDSTSHVDDKQETAPDIEDLKQKRQYVENVGRFNFFSDVGTQIAKGVNAGSRAALSTLMAFVHEVLNGESKRTESKNESTHVNGA